ncbi:MAG TPA: ABC transporter ATP-binding protein [Candidatus Binatia bacterium]|nr:ABC transporter ATP-binding protein [Candidatus Binatia bacterium]
MTKDKDASDTLVQATNLSAGYNGKTLWSDANFVIKTGEFVGLLGPNGAGKTTLFKLLLGLQKPIDGQIRIFGQLPSRGSSRVGYVPQRRPIDREMQIEALEFVRLGYSGTKWGIGSPKTMRAERQLALDSLAKVDSVDLAHRPLGQLSGGEMQRVFIAQALAGNPSLMLLDEPLANLDIRRENDIVQLVSKVAKNEKIAVILIAHDINPLLQHIKRLIYIVNGQVATGKISDIVTSKGLSKLYGASVEVLHDSKGRIAVLGTEEAAHHE